MHVYYLSSGCKSPSKKTKVLPKEFLNTFWEGIFQHIYTSNCAILYQISSEGLFYTYLDNQFKQQGQGQPQELLKCKNLVLSNISINKIQTTVNGEGIRVQGGYISNIGNYGTGFTDCKEVLISGLKITDPGVSAFYFNNATDAVKIIGCTTSDNKSLKLITNSVIVESNLSARNPKYIISNNDFEDATGNKITIQNGVMQDRVKISNNV